jgi:hypothetical protein
MGDDLLTYQPDRLRRIRTQRRAEPDVGEPLIDETLDAVDTIIGSAVDGKLRHLVRHQAPGARSIYPP